MRLRKMQMVEKLVGKRKPEQKKDEVSKKFKKSDTSLGKSKSKSVGKNEGRSSLMHFFKCANPVLFSTDLCQ